MATPADHAPTRKIAWKGVIVCALGIAVVYGLATLNPIVLLPGLIFLAGLVFGDEGSIAKRIWRGELG